MPTLFPLRRPPLPAFVGVGAQKAGTTSLHAWLRQHPQIFLPALKEVHYFDLQHGKGPRWYRRHFAAAAPGQRCGEITPYYLLHPLAPERIAALLPEARLIVLLRDPVERTLSQLRHSIRLGLEPLDPAAALNAEEDRLRDALTCLRAGRRHAAHQHQGYVLRSRYEEQLTRYETLFGRTQLLLLRSEDLFAHPEQIWPRVLAFLDVNPDVPVPSLPHDNPSDNAGRPASPALRAHLREQLEPTYRAMAERYGMVWP